MGTSMKAIESVDVAFDTEYFKCLMKEKKLTCKRLAEITGIHVSTILNYSNGHRVPVSGALYRIALVLDVAMEDLLKEI